LFGEATRRDREHRAQTSNAGAASVGVHSHNGRHGVDAAILRRPSRNGRVNPDCRDSGYAMAGFAPRPETAKACLEPPNPARRGLLL